MTVTRTPLCTVKGCPAPKDPDWHKPWCQDIPDHECFGGATHQHVPKRSQGGKRIVACLCAGAHDRIDNFDWGNDVVTTFEDGKQIETYRAWDLHNNTLIERVVGLRDGAEVAARTPAPPSGPSAPSLSPKEEPVLGAAAEARLAGEALRAPGSEESAGGEPGRRVASTAAPSTGPKEESDGRDNRERDNDSERDTDRDGIPDISNVRGRPAKDVATEGGDVPRGGRSGHGRSDTTLLPLTHEQRVAIAKEIKDTEWNRQWIAGDTANAWRAELGEEAEQYLSDFGYVELSLANIMRVCERIPKALRSSSLRFSHHVVVADLNREDMDEWLGTCEIEKWSVAEFRRQVKGTKPKVKRYSLEELRKLAKEWVEADDGDDNDDTYAFLDWLEQR